MVKSARVWDNIEAQLSTADMDHENIIKITTFLSDREYAEENSAIRQERLGNLKQALTVIITEIYNSSETHSDRSEFA